MANETNSIIYGILVFYPAVDFMNLSCGNNKNKTNHPM